VENNTVKIVQLADQIRYPQMSTLDLRETFLLRGLFEPGALNLAYVDLDRTVIGAAVPGIDALPLPCPPELRATAFTERRELGVLNIGGKGLIQVDDAHYALEKLDALYIGRREHVVNFSSVDATNPAAFYLLSYPSHAEYPTTLVQHQLQATVTLGAAETASLRKITKLIHLEGTRSSQLVMGFTELQPGSVWNTMPTHTHMRRSEVYLYFDIPEGDRVMHLMGPRDETRHLVLANREVVISPGWSIHAGVGTSSYKFCWGMGGENQVYSDMDALRISDLR
jgi:4-deoxy-L-threo-5-hexosulose-uronate ketol-isomerase